MNILTLLKCREKSLMLAPGRHRPVPFSHIALLFLSLGLISLSLDAAGTSPVSVDSNGGYANGNSNNPAITPNGRYVVYHSAASNLVDGDTNRSADIFYFDKKKGITSRISTGSQGEGNDASVDPRVSANGRFIVYSSAATNLVDGDTNVKFDIFLFDTKKGTTRRVSVSSFGDQSNGGSFIPSISGNGRYIVFDSEASNLVEYDHNLSRDIYLYDKKRGKIRMVSVDSQGNPGDADSSGARVSGNGRFVVYSSFASNLVAGDTNNASDVFLYNTKTGHTKLISVNSSTGSQGNGDSYSAHISNNGRYVVYASDAGNLVDGDANGKADIFLYDRKTGNSRMISMSNSGNQGNDGSYSPRISAQGRYVTYVSDAANLVDGDTNNYADIFRFDKKSGITSRVSVDSQGNQGISGGGFSPGISRNGRYVVYESYADTLVDGDTNESSDIFLNDLK